MRAADLRFTPEEAAALLDETAGPGLPAMAAEALGEGLARGRVLVCAPAGFGKTALLADWAGGGGRPLA